MENRIVCARNNKRQIVEVDDDEVDRVYKFRVLLGPCGTSVDLTLRNPKPEVFTEDFLRKVKQEYDRARWRSGSTKRTREINWSSKKLFLQYGNERRIRSMLNLSDFKPYKMHMLHLCDGSNVGAETFEDMWDLTPDTDLLTELPQEYTFETALADLIDNSLQAVFSNGGQDGRLISVDIEKDRISIFDSGPGMDDSDENSIVKWGKLGASLHRSSKPHAIGVKPPYLMPFFGMFGYGGPMATMQLGRRAIVSSKTKESKKVFSLHLERDVLLSRSGSWRTAGGIRDPFEEEIKKSLQGSFTKIEIFQPRKGLGMHQLQCRLKDIYFPYIQCDLESSSTKTVTPVQFEVNGTDLAEIDGGEVATTNLHSCNGPDFVLELHLSHSHDNASIKSLGSHTEANARLKCVYFPIIKGKENIELILEKLDEAGCGVQENFDTFSRVSIRRLGRLLPDARWAWLPFMEPRKKKGDRAFLLKRCCMRVKCFLETDAGFNPTRSKTDLAHHSPFTTALKNLGSKSHEKDGEVDIQILKDGKQLHHSQLEKLYEEWVLDMHERYDEDSGECDDLPVLVVSPKNRNALGVSSDVLRVHKVLKRKGKSWRRGQKIKILKGACPGFCTHNVYATIEYFIFGGLEGDACGESRMICRPLDVPDENGCVLEENDGDTCIYTQSSKSLPISVIDSGKCLAIKSTDWDQQLEKKRGGLPSTIDLLTAKDCQLLELGEELPVDVAIRAGHPPPAEILAVIRPACFVSSSASRCLDQKFIVNDNIEMTMEIKFKHQTKGGTEDHVYSKHIAPLSLKGFRGLYIFPLKSKNHQLFRRAGVYTFSFSVSSAQKKLTCNSCEKRVIVKGSSEVGKWHLRDQQNPCCPVRVGSRFPPFFIACYDIYDNQIQFSYLPKVNVKLQTDKGVLHQVDKVTTTVSTDHLYLKVEDIMIESNELDKIRPSYEATLIIFSDDGMFSVSIPCQVTPGSVHHVSLLSPIMDYQLLPGSLIKELTLEMFDSFGNHVKSGSEVQMEACGFLIADQTVRKCKVKDEGCIDNDGLLKVTAGYGEKASISVVSEGVVVFKQEFEIKNRVLRLASEVQQYYSIGSKLENIVFEVVDSEGIVDVDIHDDEKCGHSHTLTIDSWKTDDSIRYAFRKGRCSVPVIPLPLTEGSFSFVAVHSRHPELQFSVKIHLLQSPKLEYDKLQSPCSDKQLVVFQEGGYDLIRYEDRVGELENDLNLLRCRKDYIEQLISNLQASMEPCLLNNLECLATKEEMMKRIESKAHSPAALLCCLSRDVPSQDSRNHFMRDVVGLVVLLGTVHTSALSRILADYLGEDKMLAVVCRSYGAAATLEKYKQDGDADCRNALYAETVQLGRSIKGRLLAMCLDDLRPFTGNIEGNDQQRKLALPVPTSSGGYTPAGFLGYAVNMIDLGPEHVRTRTSAGHGLRETVLYNLFGELQVYETRKQMQDACECITHGAVSLDGGIQIDNGIFSLEYGKPDICFPVSSSEYESSETLKELEKLNEQLKLAERHIEKRTKALEKATKRFNRKLDKHNQVLDSIDERILDSHNM